MGRLEGRVAVVTGAGRGIGRGVALAMAAEGARVGLLDIDGETVEATAELVRAAGGELWLPRGGHMKWNRLRPRFLSFAAAAPGMRADCEQLIAALR